MDEDLIEVIEGVFKRTIFKSGSYMVSIIETTDGPITVTGPSFDYELNTKYTLTGKYVDHPKYGFQFNMLSISKHLPSAKEEIIKYLSSPIFKKVGVKAAEKIYDVFGDDTLKVLKEDITNLDKVNITSIQKKSIMDVLESESDDTSNSLFSLISLGFSSKEAHLIYVHFKEEVLNIIEDNPYRFYLEVYGISFNRVEECVKNLDFIDKETKYKEALLISIFKKISFNSGDIYLLYDDIYPQYSRYYDDFDLIIDKAIDDTYIIEDNNRYYLKQDYFDEYYIAKYLLTHNIDDLNINESNLDMSIKDCSLNDNIILDSCQENAIKNFFNYNFSIVVGGPGTGKTTIIKEMVDIFTNHFPYNNIIVIAPTGRAAKRINELCNVTSKTIHSLLRWNKDDNTFAYNESNPLLYDAIIIDEFSMVDNNLFANLLKASNNVKKICVIGDDNQLPSIRQGNVLNDLVNSNVFPSIHLSEIHRQRKGNEIITLANNIVKNNVDFTKFKNDVEFIDISNFDKNNLVNMINNNINEGYDFEDIQVLSPMYRGEFGIDALNLSLQSSFNPPAKNKVERRVADCLYRENDKILQLKNRPDDDVYNGDIGNLEEIDIENRNFLINYNNVYIYYSFDELIDISLAYALSVHKSQGSEYEIVYFICTKEHMGMLNKKLVYTAISRAKSKLIIIGNEQTFNKAIEKEMKQRKTTLIERIAKIDI